MKGAVVMPTRRQARVSRIIKEAVSDAIANHVNDPRVEGLVSVTRVDVAADLRTAEVYLSILASGCYGEINDENERAGKILAAERRALEAINQSRSRIQAFLARAMKAAKFCPVLSFHRDEQFKQTLETMKLINRIAAELNEQQPSDQQL